jgi:hypothetical protein
MFKAAWVFLEIQWHSDNVIDLHTILIVFYRKYAIKHLLFFFSSFLFCTCGISKHSSTGHFYIFIIFQTMIGHFSAGRKWLYIALYFSFDSIVFWWPDQFPPYYKRLLRKTQEITINCCAFHFSNLSTIRSWRGGKVHIISIWCVLKPGILPSYCISITVLLFQRTWMCWVSIDIILLWLNVSFKSNSTFLIIHAGSFRPTRVLTGWNSIRLSWNSDENFSSH